MSILHVVHRCVMGEHSRWDSYVIGHHSTAAAQSLPQARRDLEDGLVARLAEWPTRGLVEHTEHDLGDGMWVREALDEHALQRTHTTRVVLDALADPRLRRQLTSLPATAAGGVVVTAAVGGDTIDWIRDQHDGHGTLIVATALTNRRLWWNAVLPPGHQHTTGLPEVGTLTELELSTTDASLDEWIAAYDYGHALVADTLPSEPDHTPQH